jgi:hypothetical protein
VGSRFHGLVDSPHVRAAPGKLLNLTAVIAPDAHAAAEYYPAGYWFSLMHVPEKGEFPGPARMASRRPRRPADWLRTMKSGTCWSCHALGNEGDAQECPPHFGTYSATDAWQRRVLSGQAGASDDRDDAAGDGARARHVQRTGPIG